MQGSILIVSRNRKHELKKTLEVLEKFIDKEIHEILVYLDGCIDGSEDLYEIFPWVEWEGSNQSIGASKARNYLYRKAKGAIFFGFDDDAHPLESNFISLAQNYFLKHKKLAIIAFKEIKDVFPSDIVPEQFLNSDLEFFTRNFMGCGFAIKKSVYDKTRGFPLWMEIYGEEDCLSMEVLDLGYDILYTSKIAVNHRVDKQKRKNSGENYFRFEKQLTNTTFFYMIYYPFPRLLLKIGRLYFHNFQKYAITNLKYFGRFFMAFFNALIYLPKVIKYRKPIKKKTLAKYNHLKNPVY